MVQLALPETRYAKAGDIGIAYQVMGDGPVDLILVPGIVSHIEEMHELPGYTDCLRRLSKFARVVTFDKRGQGMSDRVNGAPGLEQRMDDVQAIMDAINCKQAVLMGFSEGSAMSAIFAATYPEKVSHLILFGGYGKAIKNEDRTERRTREWGKGVMLVNVMPSYADDPDSASKVAKVERLCASPGSLAAITAMNQSIDVRAILPTIRTPTLILHRLTDTSIPIAEGRLLASSIPGARFIEYPTGDHAFWLGDTDALVGDIEEFITGVRAPRLDDSERVLATVLFTDIVQSTEKAIELGDQKWRQLLDRHDQMAAQAIDRHRGRLIKSTGDGLLATFDGPGRAVRCALSFQHAAKSLGLAIRSGVHTGEIETRGSDVGGIAVHVAARVLGQCQRDEVLTSRVVTDLVAGAGLQFESRGSFDLKGIPGKWDLFAASL